MDTVGPYTMPTKGKETLQLLALTMIDPATGWFEIAPLPDASAFTAATAFEQFWLTRCPWPAKIICDRGTEFLGEFAEMVTSDCGTIEARATVRNPQADSMVERIHQTLGNVLRTLTFHHTDDVSPSDSWNGILSAAAFASRATFHTALGATGTLSPVAHRGRGFT